MGEGNVANGIVGEWWDKVIHADGDQVALSVSELADLSNRIDAALRRAKAEGIMEGMRETKWGIELVKDEQVRDALLRWVDAKIDVIEAKLKADELDARAAQIEEGSK